MSYVINKYNGTQLVVLEDGTIDTSTSVSLVGRNYIGYGEIQNENTVYLLENFANDTPPSRPLQGQTWFNTNNGVLNVYNGTSWQPVGSATIGSNFTEEPVVGAIWFKIPDNQLLIYTGTQWNLIGPENIPGYRTTRAVSTTVRSTDGAVNPVILIKIDDDVIGIFAARNFTIVEADRPVGYDEVFPGFNTGSATRLKGQLIGNASSADKLSTRRTINGVNFDGTSSITIKSSTTRKLVKGDYIVGSDFDGSSEVTWGVDASSSNQIGKIVVRNSSGGFAAGQITADLVGNVRGNITAETGTSVFNIVQATKFIGATLVGTAASATRLETARNINGVPFDGTSDISTPSPAETLTGTTIAANVLYSSLVQLGKQISVSVEAAGVSIGSTDDLKVSIVSSNPTLKSQIADKSINFELTDPTYLAPNPKIGFMSSVAALSNGGEAKPAFTKFGIGNVNLGLSTQRWDKIYGNNLYAQTLEVGSITPVSGTSTVNGNLTVTGNFTVEGSVTSVNSTQMVIEDKKITLANGSAIAADADGSGIEVAGSLASLTYLSSGDKWSMNKPLDMGSNDVTTTGLFRGTATSAQYADLAENYVADANYEPGTVLEIGGTFEVTQAEDGTNRLAGVVSTNPAYLMNSHCIGNHVVAVALQGRTPCKVRGKIKKGDMLVSGGNGFARPAVNLQIGTIIGKALQDFDGIEGVIEVLVGRI